MKTLTDRMRRYEISSTRYLSPRTPVILRADGQAFRTYTKHVRRGFGLPSDTPYVVQFSRAMRNTAIDLAERIQSAALVYVQSDEISILLRDWDTLDTEPWYDYNVDKLNTSTGSLATAIFARNIQNELRTQQSSYPMPIATFDCRSFNIPIEDVANYFVFRQRDTYRNFIQQIGRFHLSQKTIHGKRNVEVIEMLKDKSVDINKLYPDYLANGVVVYHERDEVTGRSKVVSHTAPNFLENKECIRRALLQPEDSP